MENSNDWFGNLLMTWVNNVLGAILFQLGPIPLNLIMVLIGQPSFWYDTITSFDFLPKDVTAIKEPIS